MKNNFDIDEKLSKEIFEQEIIPQIVGNISSNKDLIAYITGGQPGSGKSSLAREVLRKDNNLVFINGDDLRIYHPKYYKYLIENDKEAADLTQKVCNFWIESLISFCIKNKLNFIVEGTMRTLSAPLNTAKLLNENNYFINIVLISTPKELSLFTIKNRYEVSKKLGLPSRYTKEESHNEAFDGVELTLKGLYESNLINNFFIYKRIGDELELKEFNKEEKFNNILNFFKEGRNREILDKEKENKQIFNFNIKNI